MSFSDLENGFSLLKNGKPQEQRPSVNAIPIREMQSRTAIYTFRGIVSYQAWIIMVRCL